MNLHRIFLAFKEAFKVLAEELAKMLPRKPKNKKRN